MRRCAWGCLSRRRSRRVFVVIEPLHFSFSKPAEMPDRYAAQREMPDPQAVHPLQAYVAADEDIAKLAVLAFRQRDEGRVRASQGVGFATVDDVSDLDAMRVSPQEVFIDLAPRLHQVLLLDAGSRVRNDLRELAVVREQDEPAGKEIQPPHVEESL